MQNKIKRCIVASLVGAILSTVFVIGCTTQSPPTITTAPNGLLVTNAGIVTVDTNKINQVVQTLQGLNSASAPVNPYSIPIAGLLAIAGGIATSVSTVVAAVKNKQANTANGVANTIISAVENLPENIAPTVKTAVAAQAANTGTSATVNAAVQAQT